MKGLEEQISRKCIHFTGLMNKECNRGVLYDTVKDKTTSPFRLPCLSDGGSCELCELPSEKEVAKRVAEIEDSGNSIMRIHKAVKDHYEKTKEATGTIECPECKGELIYGVAQLNGHIRAKCSGCKMSFIE